MYNFSYFKEHEQQAVLEFIENHPFAFLTGSDSEGKQVVTQIPVLMVEREGELYFQGHIMRNTDHHKAFMQNQNGLLVFTGPSCYVSAAWYADPYIGSTWNYMSVHVAGSLNFMSDLELIQFMRRLTLKFEKDNADSPTFYDNLPDHFLNNMLPAIVGFEIKAEKIENVFKLSQNRDDVSYQNIIEKLEEIGGESALVAAEMRKRR
jgi:transcriptional regulator